MNRESARYHFAASSQLKTPFRRKGNFLLRWTEYQHIYVDPLATPTGLLLRRSRSSKQRTNSIQDDRCGDQCNDSDGFVQRHLD